MKPIIFSAPMVRAILDGRKRQTRRVVKVTPPYDPCDAGIDVLVATGQLEAPYQPGDVIWVQDEDDLFIRVTDVRVERVQDIDDIDLLAEGVTPADVPDEGNPWDIFYRRYQIPFMDLWDSIYDDRGYGWEQNPWVWVYWFQRVDDEEGE